MEWNSEPPVKAQPVARMSRILEICQQADEDCLLARLHPQPQAGIRELFVHPILARKGEVESGCWNLIERELEARQSGKDGELPHRPPLRTVRKSFPLYGSSTLEPQLV
jgi:hypothetical protein